MAGGGLKFGKAATGGDDAATLRVALARAEAEAAEGRREAAAAAVAAEQAARAAAEAAAAGSSSGEVGEASGRRTDVLVDVFTGADYVVSSDPSCLLQKLIQAEPQLRLSETVLQQALDFLEQQGSISSYTQRCPSRGRPRRMLHLQDEARSEAERLMAPWRTWLTSHRFALN